MLTELNTDNFDTETQKGLKDYVKKNQKQLFFTKQNSWAGENEYRVLTS